jgi:cytochrome c553
MFSTGCIADVQDKMIAYNCYSCHGDELSNLNSSQPFDENELAKTLFAFKYDRTVVTIMNRISKGYTDSELKSVAAYISELK